METIVTRETEWTPDDTALLIAQMEFEADTGSHGQPMSEATNPLADPNKRGQGWQYEAYNVQDFAAEEVARASKRLKAEYPDDPTVDSRVWGVRKVMKTPIEEPRG